MSENIYLIRCGKFYKIGVANDVDSRLAQLQTGSPYLLLIEASYKFGSALHVEKSLHQRFEDKRMRGEWFNLDEEDLDIFRSICNLLGGVDTLGSVSYGASEAEVEEAEEIQEILLGGIDWRLERRNDRNPPGYAIFQRGGDKKYLGYVGSKSLKDGNHPTIEEVEAAIARNKTNSGVGYE